MACASVARAEPLRPSMVSDHQQRTESRRHQHTSAVPRPAQLETQAAPRVVVEAVIGGCICVRDHTPSRPTSYQRLHVLSITFIASAVTVTPAATRHPPLRPGTARGVTDFRPPPLTIWTNALNIPLINKTPVISPEPELRHVMV